jgi:peptide/nickel transport system permease protein
MGKREAEQLQGSATSSFRALGGVIRRLVHFRLGLAGFIIVLFFGLLAIGAPYVAPYGENQQSYNILQPPSAQHLLGTDTIGRDTLSRIIYGSQVSMAFGFGVALLSLVLGIVLGAFPGYFGGLVDDLFSRFFDMVLMIPSFFLIILAVALFGSNIQTSMLIVALTLWPSNARITRVQVLTLKTRAYVQASVVTGAGHLRIIFKHILPNGISPVIANSALQMANAVLIEASLSFLGLSDPNHVSWGTIIFGAVEHFNAWWLSMAGVTLMTLTLGFNFAADGISYILTPRLEVAKG